MGEVAELVLEGVLCQECGVFIDSSDWPGAERMADGYPRFCRSCGGDPECNGASKRQRKRQKSRGKERAVRGIVKRWNDAKGWGFIGRAGGKDVFVHHSDILGRGRKSLVPGDEVEFDTKQTPKGLKAVNVRQL